MGFFKRKEKKAADFDAMSGKGLISYIKANLKDPSDENVLNTMQEINKPDADQNHLTKECTLPYGWFTLNREFTEQIKAEYTYFLNKWLENRNAAPLRKHETLESFVVYLTDVQKVCYSKSECHAFWFNGNIASPEYIEERTAELNELKTNFAEIEAAYKKHEKELAGLNERVMEKIRQNEGILQADLVKMFDASVKSDISEMIYQWSQEGKIDRIKSGRSYTLHSK